MMNNRILVLMLCIAVSSALKGERTNLRRTEEIINESFKAAAPKTTDPKVADPKKTVTADAVGPEPKEKKEKKVKKVATCKKVPKSLPSVVGDGSATTQQLNFFNGGEEDSTTDESPVIIINDNALPPPPPPPADEIVTGSALPPPPQEEPTITNTGALPPPPPQQPEITGDNALSAPAPPAGEGIVTEDNLPWCTPVKDKVRSDSYCASLLNGEFPDHRSLKGAVSMDVMYDESQPAVLENVKKNIKMKAARKVAGCKNSRRHRLQVQPVLAPPTPPAPIGEEIIDINGLPQAPPAPEDLLDVNGMPPPEPIYISGVKFGDFDVQDQCDTFESKDGCDKISADMEIYYEAPDGRKVTDEEAELIVTAVIDAIQLEAYEGAVVDGLSAEIQGSDRRVSGGSAGAIAGGTLTAAAVVAGVAVYKRYGNDIRAKWG